MWLKTKWPKHQTDWSKVVDAIKEEVKRVRSSEAQSLRHLRVRSEPIHDRNCSYKFEQTKTTLAICGEQNKELVRVVTGIQKNINSVRIRCRRESPKLVPLPTLSDTFSNVQMVASNCSLALTVAETAAKKCQETRTKLENDIDTLNKTLWETRCSCGIDCPAARSAPTPPTLQTTPSGSPAPNPVDTTLAPSDRYPTRRLTNETKPYQVLSSIPPTVASSAAPMVSINAVPTVQRVKSRITDEIRSPVAKPAPITNNGALPVAPDAVEAEAVVVDYDEPIWPIQEQNAKVRTFISGSKIWFDQQLALSQCLNDQTSLGSRGSA